MLSTNLKAEIAFSSCWAFLYWSWKKTEEFDESNKWQQIAKTYKLYQSFRRNLGKTSKMIILRSLLSTLEMSRIFKAAVAVPKLANQVRLVLICETFCSFFRKAG